MAQDHAKQAVGAVQGALLNDPEFLKGLVQKVQQLLELGMTMHLEAAKYERTNKRKGYRNGYKPRQLKTRVG